LAGLRGGRLGSFTDAARPRNLKLTSVDQAIIEGELDLTSAAGVFVNGFRKNIL